MSRYHVSGSEGQYEKDSGEQVLANKLGVTDADEIDGAELVLLEQLYRSVFEQHFPPGQLTVKILKIWHYRWLGNIYNGRLSRLLADVMAVQAGYKPLDYRSWEQNKTQYIAAIHAGISMNFEPMKHWVNEALRRD